MTDSQITDALANLPDLDRHALASVALRHVTEDPDDTRPMTPVWWAISCAIVAIETQRRAELDDLEATYFDPDTAITPRNPDDEP